MKIIADSPPRMTGKIPFMKELPSSATATWICGGGRSSGKRRSSAHAGFSASPQFSSSFAPFPLSVRSVKTAARLILSAIKSIQVFQNRQHIPQNEWYRRWSQVSFNVKCFFLKISSSFFVIPSGKFWRAAGFTAAIWLKRLFKRLHRLFLSNFF